ncbi:hypothetical protein [Streptomyces sp. NPDC101393]|uniref:hypothetical protein n=1 Tax=Streptomyces sp. NPDC101393 TaxID=3366141 RepID=UPI00381D2F9F
MRTTVASTSAAVLCLGALLAGCGSTPETGYAAVGAAGPGDARAPKKAVPPDGDVELTPLDGDRDDSGAPGPPAGSPPGTAPGTPGDDAPSATPATSGSTAPGGAAPGRSGRPGEDSGGAPGAPSGDHSNSPPHQGDSGPSDSPDSPAPKPPSPTIPAGPGAPAGLLIGKPDLADTDVRWCEKVTLDFLNTGDRPVTTGTVTFGTHIIGGLGVDWATRESTHELPLPLAPGKKKTAGWRVCVDAWRVPLGMHLDTQDVTFAWK